MNLASSMVELYGREYFAGFLEFLAQDLALRNGGKTGGEVPIVAPVGEISMLPTEDSYEWFTRTAKKAPNWVNQTQVESVARGIEYFPAGIYRIDFTETPADHCGNGRSTDPGCKGARSICQGG